MSSRATGESLAHLYTLGAQFNKCTWEFWAPHHKEDTEGLEHLRELGGSRIYFISMEDTGAKGSLNDLF